MSFPFFVAKRHLFSHHKIGYISFISIISIVGLAVGITALILTISILNGFEREVKTKLMGFDAHIRLRLFYQESIDSTQFVQSELSKIKEIKCIVPYIHNHVMIRHGNETDGVIIEGISENDIRKTLNVDGFITKGALKFSTDDGIDGIVIGQKLADFLDAGLGEDIYLFVLHGANIIVNRPRIERFTITGIYDSGIADYDDIFVYTSLSAAQCLFNMGDSFSGYQMIVEEPNKVDEVAKRINETLGFPYHAITWNDLHSNLFKWLKVQRIPILIVFGLIAVVAIFNVVSSLMMIVIEKTKDIGVLKGMGVNRKQITSIFLFEGLFIGIAGTILGYIVALVLSWLQMRSGIISIPKDVYFMNKLPILLCWKDFLYIGLGALLFSIIATVYPSLKAVKLSPSEALRYE